MRYMCRVENKRKINRTRNQNIRNTIKVESRSLFVENTLLRWFDHVLRMSEERYFQTFMSQEVCPKEKGEDPEKDGKKT